MVNDFSCPIFFSHGASNSGGALIGYLGKKSLVLNKQKIDKTGRILVLDITLDVDQYILINLYNPNTENEHVKILDQLQTLLKKLNTSQNKRLIFASDFNNIFHSKLEARSGELLFKENSLQN